MLICSKRGRSSLLTLFTRSTLNLHPSTIKNPPTIAARKSPGQSAPAQCNAVIYTLLGSCRRQGINPFDYLKDLFTRLPAAKITQIKKFTPAAWAKVKMKDQLVAQAA